MTSLQQPLARYAERLHAAVDPGHHVASPLGAWLLLALCGPAATGAERDELADVLGMNPSAAAATAAALLAEPHPLVPAATAVWHHVGYDPGRLADWYADLPPRTTTGPLPTQDALDAWAREHTLGLIDRFPLRITPQVVLALASALATRISWADPFDLTPAAALGSASPWAGSLTRALRAPERGHRCWIAATERAGEVIVHVATAQPAVTDGGRAGLAVVSVAAAPDVAPGDVLAAAYRLGAAAVAGAEPGRRSLFELPLGETALWSVREERVRTRARDGREERHTAVLPCWSARSEHDLTAPRLGFPTAIRAVAGVDAQAEARQAAMARFGRYGFEAAAVTGAFALVSLPPEGVARTAELRFGHPYAVVALATDERPDGVGPWHGVPVFSAWVAEPEEPSPADLADPS
ncbi:hypothetical protein U2F26_29820 [Micromonospora sp. 4G57]|uniref:Proteinase inhibitor I4 serpin n=1 Tax=Micromonospora sicca TaxID=2202420 RepID=A0ABU5JID6_9ACTN|nr:MULTISPECIES: hypothetical protein [unclassified Micromonospora]MDZ5446877.1 hypothetical protein [Micromonospora sp. 4G57]MDZ5492388.1 hypothetical protein [Micromonospora sp. 4G53]